VSEDEMPPPCGHLMEPRHWASEDPIGPAPVTCPGSNQPVRVGQVGLGFLKTVCHVCGAEFPARGYHHGMVPPHDAPAKEPKP